MPLPILLDHVNLDNYHCTYCTTRKAKFAYKNGNFCCERSPAQCPENKIKNSNGLKNSYKTGKRLPATVTYSKLDDNTKNKMAWNKGKNFLSDKRIQQKSSSKIEKHHLISEGSVYECHECKLTEWQGQKLILEIDHIDGNRFNNDISNTRFLCPNCHSQTVTYRGRNINKGNKKISDDEFINSLSKSVSIRQALISLKLAPKGGNYIRAYDLILKHQLLHLI